MNLTDALAYLDRHINLEATAGRVEGLSLERMRRLVGLMGDPQAAYPVIHLTGTNGKGSTARMITGLLQAQGLSVGTYTSPHLERINERVTWSGGPVDDVTLAGLIEAVSQLEPLLPDDMSPSYFEILTAAAFRWFADLAVDVAVVEVGLLGRWDATNVADGTVAVVTNVGHDHTDGAPGWRRSVAEEKAGIVKPGATLVLGETDPDLVPVFTSTGPAETWRRDEDFGCISNRLALNGRLVDVRTPGGSFGDLFLPVHGAHQGDNAALALAAAEVFFGRALDADLVADAFGSLSLPGRFEVVSRNPLLVLDGAHNPDGAEAVSDTLIESFLPAGRLILVVGMLTGRDPAEMLTALGAQDAVLLIACTPPSPRGVPAADVAQVATDQGVATETVPDVQAAVARALSLAGPEDTVVVTGSLYVVGAARAVLI